MLVTLGLDDDEATMSEATLTLTLEDRDEAMQLFGSRDQNLRLIREALGVRLVARGDTMHIEGSEEQVNRADRVFQQLRQMLRPQGKLLLTMPNQETLRSYLTLIFRGHFAYFTGANYPAHITALLRMDLARICAETGFSQPQFLYSDYGWMPVTNTTWQRFSFDLLRGRLFSDNLAMVVTRLPDDADSTAAAAQLA